MKVKAFRTIFFSFQIFQLSGFTIRFNDQKTMNFSSHFEMSAKLTYEILQKLPKAELHCHLDGSLRPQTVLDLAKEQNVELPVKT